MSTTEANVRYISAEGEAGRLLIVRLKPGSDFISSVKQVCQDHNIVNGYIGTCMGSLATARYIYGVPDDSLKSGAGFGPEQHIGHLCEFMAAQGTVCHDDKDEVLIHVHGLFVDHGTVRAGHFDQPGNIVGTTMEIAIQEVLGIDMTRPFDSEIDQNHLYPQQID
jgi:predicted DNA-binding protein with PD1-like motif